MARQSTRLVCPVRVAILDIEGTFHRLISFSWQPCVLTNSCDCLLNINEQTCEPASTTLVVTPVRVLRKRIVRSAVPPPDTSRPCWWGDQATAFTAASWSLNLSTGSVALGLQTSSLLSLPPEHSCCSSGDHFRPHTSCLWPSNFDTNWAESLMSLLRMVLSREPVLSTVEFQQMAPTRFEWPTSDRTFFILFMSQICTSPDSFPIEMRGSLCDHPTPVTSELPMSHSFITFELQAFQRQTLEESPTARKSWCPQSRRLRQQSSYKEGASSTFTGTLLILRPRGPSFSTLSVH